MFSDGQGGGHLELAEPPDQPGLHEHETLPHVHRQSARTTPGHEDISVIRSLYSYGARLIAIPGFRMKQKTFVTLVYCPNIMLACILSTPLSLGK